MGCPSPEKERKAGEDMVKTVLMEMQAPCAPPLSPASMERVAQPRCGDPGSHGPKNNSIYLGSFSKKLVLVMQMIIIATLDDLYIMR